MRAGNTLDAQEPLLPPEVTRPSTGGAPRRTKPDSAWYAALGRCLVYVWPKQPRLQLAACTCILLLLSIRLLNLAVPIFYGRTVDVLSNVSDDARDGRLPHHTGHAFAHAMWPWVIMYLVARFLQGGGATTLHAAVFMPCDTAPFASRVCTQHLRLQVCVRLGVRSGGCAVLVAAAPERPSWRTVCDCATRFYRGSTQMDIRVQNVHAASSTAVPFCV